MMRYLLPALAVAVLGAVLSGCDSSKNQNQTNPTPAAAPHEPGT